MRTGLVQCIYVDYMSIISALYITYTLLISLWSVPEAMASVEVPSAEKEQLQEEKVKGDDCPPEAVPEDDPLADE